MYGEQTDRTVNVLYYPSIKEIQFKKLKICLTVDPIAKAWTTVVSTADWPSIVWMITMLLVGKVETMRNKPSSHTWKQVLLSQIVRNYNTDSLEQCFWSMLCVSTRNALKASTGVEMHCVLTCKANGFISICFVSSCCNSVGSQLNFYRFLCNLQHMTDTSKDSSRFSQVY